MYQDLRNRLRQQLQKQLPFVCYRNPEDKVVKAILQKDDILYTNPELKGSGFVFAPFSKGLPTVFIPRDSVIEAPFTLQEEQLGTKESYQFTNTDKAEYIGLIERAIREIKEKGLQKVVLSRPIEVKVNAEALDIFENILHAYLNAFCYICYHPRVGLWLGATPELLFTIEHNQFTSMSLAGTLPVNETQEKPMWGVKEKEEQQMVTDHIVACLHSKLTNFLIGPQETIKAGQLWHLRTRVSGETTNFDYEEFTRLLHPTPAVCGLPVEESASFILKNEGYNREYYTGFLGEIDIHNAKEARLYVNLRCLKKTSKGVRLFVGGGITESSIPGLEWSETVYKSKTMLNMLRF